MEVQFQKRDLLVDELTGKLKEFNKCIIVVLTYYIKTLHRLKPLWQIFMKMACQIQLIERIKNSCDSIVGTVNGYMLDDQGVRVRVPVGSRIFSSPRRPYWLWDPPSLLSNGYQGLFPRGESGRGMKLTTHFQLVPRSRKCGYIHPLPHTPSWHSA
jgi:hypothetical protein